MANENENKPAIKDYYRILGIERHATGKEIKKAYLKLIRKYHPDLNEDNSKMQDKIQEIMEAYRILGNLDNRLKYSILLDKKISIPKYLDAEIKYNSKK